MKYHTQSRHPQEFKKLPMAASFKTQKQRHSISPQKSNSERQTRSATNNVTKIDPILYRKQVKTIPSAITVTKIPQMKTRSAANTMNSSKTVRFFNNADIAELSGGQRSKIHPIPNRNQMKTRSTANMVTKIRPIPYTKPIKTRSAANTTVEIFQCRFCEVVYEQEKNLKNHVLNHFKDYLNPLIPVNSLKCPECPQKCRDRITLLRHYAFTHKVFFKFGTLDDLKGRLPHSEPGTSLAV